LKKINPNAAPARGLREALALPPDEDDERRNPTDQIASLMAAAACSLGLCQNIERRMMRFHDLAPQWSGFDSEG
jgi:hypothetical protein